MSLPAKYVAVPDFEKHDSNKYDSQHDAQKVTLKEATRPAEETEKK